MTTRNYIYMLSRVLSYYYSHKNTFPKKAQVQSNNFAKSNKTNKQSKV